MMDWADFDHRRASGFPMVRRGGYDRSEVDGFLASVSDWLKTTGAEELGDEVVRNKLEQAGQTTARILLIAEQEAEELRRGAEDECASLTAEADTIANETCARAEKYATRVRAQADEDAKRMIDDAAVQAHTALREETERLRADTEAVVAEMEQRRDAAVEEVERLRAHLLEAISPHSEGTAPMERDGRTTGRRHVPTYGRSRHAKA